jgi:sodium transport system permease protein
MSMVRNIAGKELLESIRDRRTLFLSIFLPILMYPAIFLLGTQLIVAQQSELQATDSRVLVVGAGDSHLVVQGMRQNELLDVTLSDSPVSRAEALTLISSSDVDIVVDLSQWDRSAAEGSADPRPLAQAWYSLVEPASETALERVEQSWDEWLRQQIDANLAEAGLDRSTLEPAIWSADDVNTQEQRGGFLLGSFLPMFILTNVVAGALYPAIDATAGERERKTIQTLFTAPVTAVEILAGKYVGVFVVALIAGLANLISLVLVLVQGLATVPDLAEVLDVSLNASQVLGVAAGIVCIAAIVAAVALTVAVLAPTFKDASAYSSAFFLMFLMPAIYAQMPGVELTPALAFAPALGQVLLMKEVLTDGLQLDSLFLVVAGSVAWSLMAAVFAARIFADERLLSGSGGSLKLLMPRSQLRAGGVPGTDDALAWFGLMFVGMYYIGATLQSWNPQVGLLLTLWGLILGMTLLVSWRLRIDMVQTFSLRRPAPLSVLGAALMGCSGALVLSVLVGVVDQWLFPIPEELKLQMQEQLLEFFPRPTSFASWMWLFALGALSPAICEELMFRGFILSGLRQSTRPWTAVVVTAVLFGLLHLSLFRLVGTTTLGIIMGWLVLRSGSIVPAMVFHGLNNALALYIGFTWSMDAEPSIGLLAGAAGVFVAGLVIVRASPLPDRGALARSDSSGATG